jgi:hypothetical protein
MHMFDQQRLANSAKSNAFQHGMVGLAPGGGGMGMALTMAREAATPLTKGFASLFRSDVPNAIIAAIQGGGSPFGAVGSLMGKKLGENITTKLGGALSGKLGSTLGAAVGSVIPGLGTMIGGLVGPLIGKGLGALGKGIGKLFGFGGGEKGKIDKQREELYGQFGGWEGMNSALGEATGSNKLMGDLMKADNAKEYESVLKRVNQALGDHATKQNEVAQNQQRANELMQKYGISIEETGGKFRNQRMKEMGEGLVADFTDLVGILDMDMDTALTKMGGSINEFVGAALRTGTEVPEAMRPMIERMIEMGTLTDANGNKITSLEGSGITFAETMTQGFDKVVNRLELLLKGMGIDVPEAVKTSTETVVKQLDATTERATANLSAMGERANSVTEMIAEGIRKIPREVPIDFVGNVSGIPDGFEQTGEYRDELPGAAAGGLFSKPAIRVVAEKGPEVVGSPDAIVMAMERAMAAANVGRGGADPEVLAKLESAISRMRGDLQSLGPTLYRAVRDGVLMAN